MPLRNEASIEPLFWIFECFKCGWRRKVTFHLTRCPRCDEPEAPF